MKKVLLFVAVVATLGFASCTGNKQAELEKAKADSLAEVARLDSIAQAEADSIAAAAVDTLQQATEEAAAVK
jgi:hypothetical protein